MLCPQAPAQGGVGQLGEAGGDRIRDAGRGPVLDVFVYLDAHAASRPAADRLADWLTAARTFVPAAGQSPLELYGLVAERKLSLPGLHVFALDEYVGVPPQ